MECVEQLNFIKPKNNLSKPPIAQIPFTQKYHRYGSRPYTEWNCNTDYFISYMA